MSTGGGSTKTTTSEAPWEGQQAYLKDVFGRAGALQNQYQGTPTPQAGLWGAYIQEATGTPTAGQGYVDPALIQGLQFQNTANPYTTAIQAVGSTANPFQGWWTDAASQTGLNTGISQNLQDVYAGLRDVAGQGYNNPAFAQLNQTASGDYLSPDSNPYMQRAVQSALDQAKASIAGQFNQGGRFGSGQMQDVQSRALGDIAAQAYTQQYQQERQNQLNAQNAIGGLYQGAVGQQLAGQQAAGGLAQNQVQNYLQSLGLGTGAQEAQLSRQLGAQEATANNVNAAQQLQNQAIGLAPYAQSLHDARLSNVQNAAGVQQWQLSQPEQQAWDRLNQYASLVAGNNWGGAGSTSTPYYQNTGGSILGGLTGLAGLGLGLGSLFSSRQLKVAAAEPPDVDAIVAGARALPIDRWRYLGEDAEHIGPYAEDFAAMFGVGDGFTISIVDALGVLFITVQYLLRRLDYLERRNDV